MSLTYSYFLYTTTAKKIKENRSIKYELIINESILIYILTKYMPSDDNCVQINYI